MARNIFSRQVRKLQQRWYPMADAKRIAYAQQVKNWNLIPGTYQLTDIGKEYSNLFSEKRAVVRKQRAKQNAIARKQKVLQGIWS